MNSWERSEIVLEYPGYNDHHLVLDKAKADRFRQAADLRSLVLITTDTFRHQPTYTGLGDTLILLNKWRFDPRTSYKGDGYLIDFDPKAAKSQITVDIGQLADQVMATNRGIYDFALFATGFDSLTRQALKKTVAMEKWQAVKESLGAGVGLVAFLAGSYLFLKLAEFFGKDALSFNSLTANFLQSGLFRINSPAVNDPIVQSQLRSAIMVFGTLSAGIAAYIAGDVVFSLPQELVSHYKSNLIQTPGDINTFRHMSRYFSAANLISKETGFIKVG